MDRRLPIIFLANSAVQSQIFFLTIAFVSCWTLMSISSFTFAFKIQERSNLIHFIFWHMRNSMLLFLSMWEIYLRIRRKLRPELFKRCRCVNSPQQYSTHGPYFKSCGCIPHCMDQQWDFWRCRDRFISFLPKRPYISSNLIWLYIPKDMYIKYYASLLSHCGHKKLW